MDSYSATSSHILLGLTHLHNLAVIALVNRIILLSGMLRHWLFRSISFARISWWLCISNTLFLASGKEDFRITLGFTMRLVTSNQINILKGICSGLFSALSFKYFNQIVLLLTHGGHCVLIESVSMSSAVIELRLIYWFAQKVITLHGSCQEHLLLLVLSSS